MKPIICNKNPIVSIPFGEKNCEYWLVTTTDLHSVKKPSRDNAYLLPNGDFYVYNGNKFVHVNDHSNLKVKWGNVIGDINNQKDLQSLFQEVNKKIDANKNNIAQNSKKITSLETRADNLEKKDQDLQTQIDGIDYVKSISRNGTLLNKDQERNVDISVPENVSDLSNDLGYITPEYLDRNNYVKNITRNGAFLPNNDGTVDIQVPDKLSQIHDDIGLANSPNWTFLEAVTVDFNKNDKTFLTKKAPMCTELLVEYYVNDRMVETETVQIDGSKPGTRTLRKGLMFSTDDGTKYPIDTSIDFGVISVVTRYEVAVSVDNKLTNTEAVTSLVNKLEMKFYYRKRESADSLAEYSTLKKQVKTNTDDVTQLKQDLLTYIKVNRTGKLYGVKKWKSNINPTSSCDKLYDNVGLVCEPSTDTVEGRDDYEDINIFKWKRVNYKRYDDGFAYPIAFEGDENFNNVDKADVGNIYQTFYYNEIDKGDYTELVISDSPNPSLDLKPWEESVRADGTVMPYYIMSAYDASLGPDGLLHSLPNKKIEAFMSHNKMISEFQKKGKGYWGAGSSRMTFAQIFSQIKYGTKDIQSVMAGCTGYASQLKATIQSSDKTNVFPILKSQVSLIEIGSRVSVGYGRVDSGNKINLDRSIATVHAYADQVKVLKIEDAEDGTNFLVYLDCEPFNTMPIDHSESGLKLDITLSTMPWHSGSTDAVIKHHDGSLRSNSNSRMPCRIQGIEYFCGKYIIASDTVIFNQPDTSKEVYFAPRGIKHTDNDSLIKQTYTKIGKIPPAKAGNGADYWVGDVEINHGAWFPSAELATQNSYKDRLYFGGNATSGSREYLQGGGLGAWSYAGLSYLSLWDGLGGTRWYCACAD